MASHRLLVVTESLGIGGTESHLLRTLPMLAVLGYDISVFCLTERGEGASSLEQAGIDIAAPILKASRTRPMRYAGHLLSEARRLYAFMRRSRPDIVHFYLPRPYLVGAPAAMAAGVPIKIMSRRSLANYQRNWPTAARIERRLHHRMDALIGNSAAVVDDLIAEDAPRENIRLIYNGIAIPKQILRDEARRALGLDADMLVGVVVANLIHYKGHRELLAGLAEIKSNMPDRWRILLAGRDHDLWPELKAFAERHKFAGKIQFLGPRSDVPLLLAAADFGALTSKEEGFSNVVLESMAAGLPMIVTAVGGNPEAVIDGETGLLVPPSNNAEAIGNAILRFAADPTLRKRLGDAGRNRVVQEFSLDRCVGRHAELYQQLIAKERRRKVWSTDLTREFLTPVAPVRIHAQKPRALMLAYWGRYGALPQLTLELARASQRLGQIDGTTISISTTNELFEKYRHYGQSIFPIQTYQSFPGALNLAGLVKARSALAKRLDEDGAQAFVSLMSHIWSPLMRPVLAQMGVRHTVIVHDADAHQGDRTAWVNHWLLREAQAADQVVTLTRAVAERLITLGRIPEEKITVLFHPDLHYEPRFWGQPTDKPLRVLFFGRILPYKGINIFVEAVELLREDGIAVEVGVFGQGELRERERLEALGAEIRNEWIDPADISGILSRHDVMVVSHTNASQSGVIAAAHGALLPVITTPVGGLTEQIIHKFNGIIATEVTGAALAREIKVLTKDRILLHSLRRNISISRPDRSIERFFAELSEVAFSGRRKKT